MERDLTNTTLEDILSSPEEYGMPTFQEFCRRRGHYIRSDEHAFNIADRGSELLKNSISKYKYEIEGYQCDSLEQVERTAKLMGFQIKDLTVVPELIPDVGHKATMLIKFMSKKTYDKKTMGIK